jgi:hypothetical protein
VAAATNLGLSFTRKRESMAAQEHWMPAFAGMTGKGAGLCFPA